MNVAHVVEIVLVPVVTGVLGAWIYARVFRARHDRSAEDAVAAHRDQADSDMPAAIVHLTQSPIPWVGWLSDEVIDIPPGADPGIDNTRFPGHERAMKASEPHEVNGAELVRSEFSFDLTGTHHTRTKVTRIRAVVDERRPVPTGTVYYAVPQGTLDKDLLAFDLGSPDLDARTQDFYGTPTHAHYLDAKVVDLGQHESIGFRAEVFAPLFGGHDIRYHLEISFTSGPPVAVYNEAGQPFRIVSYPTTAQRAYIAASLDHRVWPGYPTYGGELDGRPAGG